MLKTKSPFAEEAPNLGVLFLESPKASFPGQTGHAHTPPLGPRSGGEDAKPTQKPGGHSHGRGNPDLSPAVLVLTGAAGGVGLAFFASSLVLDLGLFFIPLCHIGTVPMRPLGMGKCSHGDKLFKKAPTHLSPH